MRKLIYFYVVIPPMNLVYCFIYIFSIYLKKNVYLLFIFGFFVAACWLSLVLVNRGYSLAVVPGLLIAVASPVLEHRLQDM